MRERNISPFWLLFILTGLNLFNYLDRYVVDEVVSSIQSEFQLTDGQTGLINSAFMIGYFVTAPFLGILAIGCRASGSSRLAFSCGAWAPS